MSNSSKLVLNPGARFFEDTTLSTCRVEMASYGRDFHFPIVFKVFFQAFLNSSSIEYKELRRVTPPELEFFFDFLIDNAILVSESLAYFLRRGLLCDAQGSERNRIELGEISKAGDTFFHFGCPFDYAQQPPRTSSGGPRAMRQHLNNDPRSRDLGDILYFGDEGHQGSGARITHTTNMLFKKEKRFILLGGDHSVTYYSLRGLERPDSRVSVLHFDAHCDVSRSSIDGLPPLNHANVMSYVSCLPSVRNILQIGVRRSQIRQISHKGIGNVLFKQITVDDIKKDPICFTQALEELGETPIYISFDIDVVDPKAARLVTTPLDNGLSENQVQCCFEILKKYNRRIIGVDVVELCASCSSLETEDRSSYIAYSCISKILSHHLEEEE